LLQGIYAAAVTADKAYDANDLVESIEEMGATPVIPSKQNRKIQRKLDTATYKLRSGIERFFCRIKHFRRIATRYDKLDRRFASFILVVTASVWGCLA
jgi:transposase